MKVKGSASTHRAAAVAAAEVGGAAETRSRGSERTYFSKRRPASNAMLGLGPEGTLAAALGLRQGLTSRKRVHVKGEGGGMP